jgi:Lon protease-like protein
MSAVASPVLYDPSALPKTLPVFPLSGVVMLPHARLPLNVFEPRYLSMVQDVLGHPDRMIGIIQPTEPEEQGKAPQQLYKVGCAGRITSFTETEDGRFLIGLTGACRFAVGEELKTTAPYRIVRPEWQNFLYDLDQSEDTEIDRKRLIAVLQDYFRQQEIPADWNAIQSTTDDMLISSLVMICPLAPNEKQALLEAGDLHSRAEMLTALLEMAAFPQTESEGGVRH